MVDGGFVHSPRLRSGIALAQNDVIAAKSRAMAISYLEHGPGLRIARWSCTVVAGHDRPRLRRLAALVEGARLGKLLGEAIRAEMYAVGMSQTKLAKELGIDQPRISKVVRGRQEPYVERLWSIAVALNAQDRYDEWLRLREADQQERREQRRQSFATRRGRTAEERRRRRSPGPTPAPAAYSRVGDGPVSRAEATPSINELAAEVQQLREADRDMRAQLASMQARLWRLENDRGATHESPKRHLADVPEVRARHRHPPGEERATHGFDPVDEGIVPPGQRD